MIDTVLNYIARTNLFNFVLFVSIITFIFIKLDIVTALEDAKNSVKESIDNSDEIKLKSEQKLSSIEEKFANLSVEIEAIINNSVDNAKLVGEKLISDANAMTELMRANAEKQIENKTAILKNDILKRASQVSIEIAKDKIVEELSNNYELHNRFIDESVEKIGEVNL